MGYRLVLKINLWLVGPRNFRIQLHFEFLTRRARSIDRLLTEQLSVTQHPKYTRAKQFIVTEPVYFDISSWVLT